MNDEAVKWLREQITARLETAQAAAAAEGGSHAAWLPAYGTVVDAADEDWAVITDTVDEIAAHMALNDPQDVIARCEAELAILDTHAFDTLGKFGTHGPPRCTTCLSDRDGYEEQWEADPWPCQTVRLLASGYKHREGYAGHWG